MSVKHQWKLLVGGLGARRANSAAAGSAAAWRDFLDRNRLVSVLIFVFTVAVIVLLSSAGVSTINLPVLAGQLATVRATALAPFSYVSEQKTSAAREQFLNRVPRVYRLDFDALQKFETGVRDLFAQLDAFELEHPAPARTGTLLFSGQPAANDRRAGLTQLAETSNARGVFRVTSDELAAILTAGDAKARAALLETGITALRQIYADGVQDAAFGGTVPGSYTVYQIARPSGGISVRPVQSREDGLTFLRVSLATEGVPRPAMQAFFRLFSGAVQTNLVFDRAATNAREAEALQALKPVTVNVARGQIIIEPGERVTPEQSEMLQEHRKYLLSHGDAEIQEGLTLFGRVLLVLAMVLASLLYMRLEDPETLHSNVRCGLLALVVIVNVALVRIVYQLGGAEFFVRDGSWASTLPYVAPTALAPIIVAILIDAGSAIFMALFISIFAGVIYGNRLELLVLTFLASLVSVYFCRDARRRGKVVRAAGAGGLTVAAFAALIAFADQTPLDTLARQMAAGLFTGLLTGVAVVGLLPVLESLFKRTTDITLLELTDYNHPLLRRMQMEAPGTYHHSLVVAQLSENAANAIGANPLLARVCALFHDIGKTLNPQFFTENQRDRTNPHDEKDPHISAEIIKRHVADGVELAHKHNLPRAVSDVIRQHHGTTLVRYFYQRAVEQSLPPFATEKATLKKFVPETRSAEKSAATIAPVKPVPEAPFRYDGPRPQFKESAVISLADGVEAASRSLRSATAEQLVPLIDSIIAQRIAEGQLDEAPLTFEDIAKIKNSFQFTLLNMLHARLAYAVGDAEAPVPQKKPHVS